jgi:REP element-mobilizing transposase RayT
MLASHIILSFHSFWLPNDPRGSWSDFVGHWELLRFGHATKVDTHRSLAAEPHNRQARLSAKKSLKYPEIKLTGREALAVGHGFSTAIAESNYQCHACAILPEHVHLVIAATPRPFEQLFSHLKGRATQALIREAGWPTDRPLWARGGWKVFLDRPEDVLRAIRYVEQNPIKEGKPFQSWPFVQPFIYQS